MLGILGIELLRRHQEATNAPPRKASAFRAMLHDSERATASLARRDKTAAVSSAPKRHFFDFGTKPPSLEGTQIDGALTLDAAGHFVPTREALDLFNYFLTATGEEPLPALYDRIVHEIETRLPAAAANEAIAFFENYLEYLERVRGLHEAGQIPWQSYETSRATLQNLRSEIFGADLASTLFQEQDLTAQIGIEQYLAANDPNLSATARQAKLAQLEAKLPTEIREARAKSRAALDAHYEVSALRESGASEAEIHTLRSERFGTEAADRLAKLDAERATWNARLEKYRAERDTIVNDPARSEANRAAALDALRASHFAKEEIPRVRALDTQATPVPPNQQTSPASP